MAEFEIQKKCSKWLPLVYNVQSMYNLCTISNVPCTNYVQSQMYIVQSQMYIVYKLFKISDVHCTMDLLYTSNVQPMYNLQCSLYKLFKISDVHCTMDLYIYIQAMYNLCTLYIIQPIFV